MADTLGDYPIIQLAVAGAIGVATAIGAALGIKKSRQVGDEEQNQLKLFSHLTPTLDIRLTLIKEGIDRNFEKIQRVEDRIEKLTNRIDEVLNRLGRRTS